MKHRASGVMKNGKAKTAPVEVVIIERLKPPLRYYGETVNYRVRGTTRDGAVAWTGRGFEHRPDALEYADAVYTGAFVWRMRERR